MVVALPEKHEVSVGATEVIAIDYTSRLRDASVLTGTPTAVEQTTSDLTLASVAVNTATVTISEATVAIGKAVTFTVTGQLAGVEYQVRVTAGTDQSPAETLIYDAVIQGV